MTEQDPKDTEATEAEVTPAEVDPHEPGAAAEAAEKAQGQEAAAEAKPKRRRARKAKAEATEEPAAEEKPKRARRKKAEPTEEPTAEAKPAEEAKPAKAAAAEAEVEEKPKRARRAKKDDEKAAPKEDAPKPAPTRRRGAQPTDGRLVVVRAQAKYVRSSARKARLVCDQIRGKSVEDARAILATTPRAVARDWSKVLESAIANAENNHELVGEDLRIKSIHADEGPTLKRFRPRAMGRATKIRKRTSHLTILLSPKD
jgi:ribosomal protein L22